MKCNRDCFNCPFPDCIKDTMTLDEFRATEDKPAEKKKNMYYERNREKYIARAKKWQQDNSERYKEVARKRYLRNRETRLAYQAAYWQQNKDDIMRRRREKRQVQ